MVQLNIRKHKIDLKYHKALFIQIPPLKYPFDNSQGKLKMQMPNMT
jgi:hypothetical protein